MANKRLSEGVGKKIVDALKKQSEIEINPISSDVNQDELDLLSEETMVSDLDSSENPFNEVNLVEDEQEYFENHTFDESSVNSAPQAGFEESLGASAQSFVNYQQPSPIQDAFMSELDTFEIPGNIAVLKKLITQLPSGVTRHTGAQIIKQTMEALGISMKSVLQEAQQVQDGLNNSAKECYSTMQEYKKQIMILEKQAQSHQKQYAALNELISLFIQTGV